MKVMKCRDVGLDCDFVAHGETDDQIMSKVAEHAKSDHGMETVPPEVVSKVKSVIHDE